MPAARPEETDLLVQLYAGATGQAGLGQAGWGQTAWDAFLALLAGHTRADGVTLVMATGATRLRTLGAHGAEPPAELMNPDDPCGLFRMRPERVHAAGDMPGPARWPTEVNLRAMAVRMADGGRAWLMLTRRGADFRAVDAALLSALAPHLPQAVMAATRLAAERAQSGLHAALNARLGTGWLILDRDGRVSDHDATAVRLLASTARLRRGQRLALRDLARETALARALERARLAGAAAVALGGAPAPGLLVMTPPPDMGWPMADLIGVLRGVPQASNDAALVAQMFALPLSEARLALALARGASLREAAAELGLTEQTARSYSRQIFARTGWRGQPDLMRALLTSAIWLAPGIGAEAGHGTGAEAPADAG